MSLPDRPFPLLAIIWRTCSLCLLRLRARRPIIDQEMMAARVPPTNMMVTMRPDVVSLSSFFMHEFAPAVGEKQRSPGAQDDVAVTVGRQENVLPWLTEHADVAKVLVI
jgi:hypothetical protein